jgi:hypothetical protein
MVLANNVEAEVDPRSRTRRGENVTVINKEDIRIEGDRWVDRPEFFRQPPVSRCDTPVEHARGG